MEYNYKSREFVQRMHQEVDCFHHPHIGRATTFYIQNVEGMGSRFQHVDIVKDQEYKSVSRRDGKSAYFNYLRIDKPMSSTWTVRDFLAYDFRNV